MLETALYDCPYCGEEVETTVDLSGGDQEYVEDCQVCCRPIKFRLQVHDEHWFLEAFTEND
ncbi:CPXCG motif-containing cysteine-rich protein [Pseudomonas sp. ICMP22404]|uniref:CPXCG motif-containing cysteine-rich protein n=1 Tax=Pseudomonas TaxID=286 RepID=UPI00111BB2DC|nr:MULTISPECIES: CPXCG motif-containing cysteine-rich protein [Pseudomonas]MCI0998028.1 CPXCG motif-containing cysteine-rich protein [Pseudomonas corrugata]NUT67875.1 CPXCG motif-containing cysteine-rich protein [Pseudomonas corrugata]TNF83106.1 CPXCG motif-containing cysteine-rich protein [Pseudomonas sp. ICMP22404]